MTVMTNEINNYDQKRKFIIKILNKLKILTQNLTPPLIDLIIKDYKKDPFLILIACLLSLRSRDTVTYKICKKLFSHIKTVQEFAHISDKELEKLIYGVNFYRKKAKILINVSQDLIKRFKGKVPNNKKDLLSIKGIGLKTANIVMSEAFDVPAIAVDTHVNKISNLLGLVDTNDPKKVEIELEDITPKNRWREINHYFVIWGQNIKNPIFKEINKNLKNNF